MPCPWWALTALCLVHGAVYPDPFAAFLRRFGRDYSPPEVLHRRATFAANMERAAELSAADPAAQYFATESPFGDWTSDEFRRLLGLRVPADKTPPLPAPRDADAADDVPLPPEWDWQARGAVTAVKDQGAVGTCWAFSAVGAVEGQLAISARRLEDLSVEQLVECDGSSDAAHRVGDCGLFGGWPALALRYLIRAGGLRADRDMPYCVGARGAAHCMPCMPLGYDPAVCGDHSDLYCNASGTKGQGRGWCASPAGAAAVVTNVSALPADEAALATALVSRGPLSVGLNAGLLQLYRRGVWSPPRWLCDPAALDHAVLLVGYGVDRGRPFWRLKNSWGPRWGEGGYFRMARGTGLCGVDRAAVAVAAAPAPSPPHQTR